MSATQVPLRPIAKGSLLKFWIAMAVLVALAFALATCSTSPLQGETSETGVNLRVLEQGEDEPMTLDDAALVEYVGSLAATGEVFEDTTGSPVPMYAQALVPGFAEVWTQMRPGGRYRLFLPAEQAYGSEVRPGSPIPPNSDLVFELTIVEVGRGIAPMLIAQQQQMQGGGGPPPTAPGEGPPPVEGAGPPPIGTPTP
ncbi:FKBP-type peptidyl-prolyl cis-trans isomerase [Sphingomicrobium sp. XHP0239]|uniref:FKBP-type peptidyl-prolyl cis-trans isomerase n=1 Tax=Sphingomicrobium maritimum TaxID=3133972 RepID=UPI0031CC9C80